MNFWAFTPALFAHLGPAFQEFLSSGSTAFAERREFLIPTVVRSLIEGGAARVRVIPTESPWTGITYPGDRARVEERIRSMVRAGEYPDRLWAQDRTREGVRSET